VALDATTVSPGMQDPSPSSLGVAPLDSRPKLRLWLVITAVIFCATAAGTFAAALFRAGRNPVTVAVVRMAVRKEVLHLRVDPDEVGLLRLSWNPTPATAGTLFIQDGENATSRELDAAELRSGWIVYKPLSNNVFFRVKLKSFAANSEGDLQASSEAPANPPKAGRVSIDEVSAYDEIPHRNIKPRAQDEVATYDPSQRIQGGNAGKPSSARYSSPATGDPQTDSVKTSPPER